MYKIDKDFSKIEFQFSLNPGIIPATQLLTKTAFYLKRPAKGVISEKLKIKGYENKDITIELFRQEHSVNEKRELKILFYIHGGGFILHPGPYHKELISEYVLGLDCCVVYIDYSLAPQFPYPHGLEDCYAGIKWVLDNSESLDLDTTGYGLCGISAGGALTAGVNYLLYERLNSKAAFQMLIYPVTDNRMKTPSMAEFPDTPMWNSVLNRKMWAFYLPEESEYNKDHFYAVPMDINHPEILPSTYIEVAEIDCLRDEGIEYYKKLKAAGVKATLNQTKGTIHSFEFNLSSKITRNAVKERIRFAEKNFKKI